MYCHFAQMSFPMRNRRTYTPSHAFARLRWEHLRDFVEMADAESAAMFVDMLALNEAYISQPMTPEEYDDVREAAQLLGIRQAMFMDAGAMYDGSGFKPATRMLVFGHTVQQLLEAYWPYNASATDPLLALVTNRVPEAA
jgi:hypothetical protein